MACPRCHGRGYIEDVQRRNGGEWNILLQCCDITKYSQAVADRKACVERETQEDPPAAHVCSVLQFRPRKRERTE